MKMKYEKPMLLVEDFLANECVAEAHCTRLDTDIYKIVAQDVQCYGGSIDKNVFANASASYGCTNIVTTYKQLTAGTYYFKNKHKAKEAVYDWVHGGTLASESGASATNYRVAVTPGYYLAWGSSKHKHSGPVDASVVKTASY